MRFLFPSFGTSRGGQYKEYSDAAHNSKSRDFYRLQDRGGSNFPRGTDEIALTNDIRKGAGDSAHELDPEDDPNYGITVQRDILWTSQQAGK